MLTAFRRMIGELRSDARYDLIEGVGLLIVEVAAVLAVIFWVVWAVAARLT